MHPALGLRHALSTARGHLLLQGAKGGLGRKATVQAYTEGDSEIEDEVEEMSMPPEVAHTLCCACVTRPEVCVHEQQGPHCEHSTTAALDKDGRAVPGSS